MSEKVVHLRAVKLDPLQFRSVALVCRASGGPQRQVLVSFSRPPSAAELRFLEEVLERAVALMPEELG
jgi:hypothetical protein